MDGVDRSCLLGERTLYAKIGSMVEQEGAQEDDPTPLRFLVYGLIAVLQHEGGALGPVHYTQP